MKLFSTLFLLLLIGATAQAATLIVTNANDTGAGSLRAAILTANTNAQADTITFDPAFFNQARTITITTAASPFNFATDANPTVVTNTTGQPITLSGGTVSSVIVVNAGTNVTLNNLQIANGNSAGFAGAGIFNAGTVTINNCAVFNNNTGGGNGAGVQVNGASAVANVNNSTVTGNTGATGGGVRVFAGTLNVTSSTVAGNTATTAGGGVVAGTGTTYNIRNTISAGNTAPTGPDASGTFISGGFNLIGNGTGGTGFTQPTDQVGTAGAPINPQLGAFTFYGGPTQTFRLLPNSPALDKGNSFGLTTDQRGLVRPYDNPAIPNAAGGDGADIGAFEQQAPSAAGVIVSGKVMTPTGKALSRATVIMTDMAGVVRTVSTDRRGNFVFTDVRAGESYIFEVRSKLYHFNSQVITVTEDLDGVNFTATN